MKKQYFKPEIDFVEAEMNQPMLAESIEAVISDMTQGNEDALSPELLGIDDDVLNDAFGM